MGICTKCGVAVNQTHTCLPGNIPDKPERQAIIDQLDLLDKKLMRPLTEDEPEKVKEIVEQKLKLREQLKEIE